MVTRFPLRSVSLLIAAAVVISAQMRAGDPGITTVQAQQTVAAKTAELPQPVVDTHGLMELFNKPFFMTLKKEMQMPPSGTGDEGWQGVQDRGLQAAEIMNLVAIREVPAEKADAWRQHTHNVRQAGLLMAEKAKAKNWDQTREAYRMLVQSCNGCHQAIAPDRAPQLAP